MPWDQVMHKFKHGSLHSGKGGPRVTSRPQAIAIMLSEKRKASAGVKEYKGRGVKKLRGKNVKRKNIGPSEHVVRYAARLRRR